MKWEETPKTTKNTRISPPLLSLWIILPLKCLIITTIIVITASTNEHSSLVTIRFRLVLPPNLTSHHHQLKIGWVSSFQIYCSLSNALIELRDNTPFSIQLIDLKPVKTKNLKVEMRELFQGKVRLFNILFILKKLRELFLFSLKVSNFLQMLEVHMHTIFKQYLLIVVKL